MLRAKASTSVAAYAALLWAYDLLSPPEKLADPLADKEGLALAPVEIPHERAIRG